MAQSSPPSPDLVREACIDGVGDLLEAVGRAARPSWRSRSWRRALRERVTSKYRDVVFDLISDITLGAGALIVGGGMVCVIFFDVVLHRHRGRARRASRASS